MIEDGKIILTNRLEEKTSEVNWITHIQLETMNHVMITNHELNRKDIEIISLEL